MHVNAKGFCLYDSDSMNVESESSTTYPDEILVDFFSYLRPSEVFTCARTCKKWHQVAYDDSLPLKEWMVLLSELEKKNSYIGSETLKQCIGEIGKTPPLTRKIFEELQSPDPQNEGKKKKETHILALIPETINGHPLTLNSLNEFKNFRYYWSKIKEEYGDKPYPNTSWVLMTKDVLQGSRGEKRENLLRMASLHGKGYRAPTLLEAAFIHTMLPGDDDWGYTCCLDKPISGWKLVVGSYARSNIRVHCSARHGAYDAGVAALRKF